MKDVVIIGGGISGLSCAFFLRHYIPDISLSLLEKSDRLGGSIHTFSLPSGQMYESGPRTLRFYGESSLPTLHLLSMLSLQEELIPASKAAKNRYIILNKKMTPLPHSLYSSLTSPIGRHLIKKTLLEPFHRKGDDADESVSSFFSRRAPSPIVEKLVDALCSGIWGGDPQQLSIYGTLYKLKQFELSHGSVVAGGISSLFSKKNRPKIQGIYALKNGLSSLISCLENRLKDYIHMKDGAAEISKENSTWTITTTSGKKIQTKRIILAMPHDVMRKLYPSLFIFPVPQASFATVVAGYKKPFSSPQGYGVLAPSTEDPHVLGIIFDSFVFPQQTIAMPSRFSIILGGSRFPSVLEKTDDEIIEKAQEALYSYTGISDAMDECAVVRSAHAIPHPPVGGSLLKPFLSSQCNKIHAIGPSIGGVSVSNCIASAHALALHCILS